MEHPDDPIAAHEELGDLLFALSSLARHLKVDPEDALNSSVNKFHRRFRHIEDRLREKKQTPLRVSLDDLEKLWEEAKLLESQSADNSEEQAPHPE